MPRFRITWDAVASVVAEIEADNEAAAMDAAQDAAMEYLETVGHRAVVDGGTVRLIPPEIGGMEPTETEEL